MTSSNLYGYVYQNPNSLLDGLDVFLEFGPADLLGNGTYVNLGGYHGWLVLSPNNPEDFASDPRFSDGNGDFTSTSTIAGECSRCPFNGYLNSEINNSLDRPASVKIKLDPPCGLSDTQFIKLLEALGDNYQDGTLRYDVFNQNSNSFIHGLLNAADVNVGDFFGDNSKPGKYPTVVG